MPGNSADLNTNVLLNYTDLRLLVNKWLYQEVLLREQLDRDGVVDFADFSIVTLQLMHIISLLLPRLIRTSACFSLATIWGPL